MHEIELIADELRRSVEGQAWHGPAIHQVLQGVDADAARVRPIPNAHTIWEIVRHMTAWVNEVERRLRERAAPLNGEADWPPPVEHGADAWERDKAALRDAHVKLRMTIRDFSPRRLADPVVNDEADGTSFYVMLHGLAQHDAYHAGQIAILKKAAVTTPS